MKKFAFLAAMPLAFAATPTQAQDADVYVGASAGHHDIGVSGIEDSGFIFGGVVGVDFPTSEQVSFGVEGNYHFGTDVIESEYGVAGRVAYAFNGGTKAYVRGGYQEVDFDIGGADEIEGLDTTEGDYLVGAGLEFGVGGLRLRAGVDTIAFDSTRLNAALLFGF